MEKLVCIITGPERNGTTLVEKIIYSHPDIFGGFETGLLLGENFNECEPFCKWIYQGGYHWGLDKKINLTGKSFKEKYNLLFKHKGSAYKKSSIQKLIHESKYLVDKTPAYIRNLEFVHKNIPNDIPIIIIIKNLKDDYISKIVKRRTQIKEWEKKSRLTLNSLSYIKTAKKTHSNIFLFNYSDVSKDIDGFIKKIKTILRDKINTDTEMSLDKYIEKVGKTEKLYGNWKPNNLKADKQFSTYKKLEALYDDHINELKEKF